MTKTFVRATSAALLAGLLIACGTTKDPSPGPAPQSPAAPSPSRTVTRTPTPTLPPPVPTAPTITDTPQDDEPTPRTIGGDDTVHIGEDVPAGSYRAITGVESGAGCYWQKSSDPEGQKIIANGLHDGGRPQVDLRAGQWFRSSGCPTWQKR